MGPLSQNLVKEMVADAEKYGLDLNDPLVQAELKRIEESGEDPEASPTLCLAQQLSTERSFWLLGFRLPQDPRLTWGSPRM